MLDVFLTFEIIKSYFFILYIFPSLLFLVFLLIFLHFLHIFVFSPFFYIIFSYFYLFIIFFFPSYFLYIFLFSFSYLFNRFSINSSLKLTLEFFFCRWPISRSDLGRRGRGRSKLTII